MTARLSSSVLKYASVESTTVDSPHALHSDQPAWITGIPYAGSSLLTLPRTVTPRSVRLHRAFLLSDVLGRNTMCDFFLYCLAREAKKPVESYRAWLGCSRKSHWASVCSAAQAAVSANQSARLSNSSRLVPSASLTAWLKTVTTGRSAVKPSRVTTLLRSRARSAGL